MSHARLTTSVLARLAAAGPSGRPRTPTPENILVFSSPSQKSCASYTKPRVHAIGGGGGGGGGGGIPTAEARRWLANTTTPANRPSAERQPSSNTHHDGGGSSNSQPAGGAPTLDDAISFKSLGMTRGVRIVVYTALGIFGTMETIFWIKVFWRWWTGKGEEDEPQA
ncbi:hypothetical protein F5X96DRAFT_183450 [Biscogniauxia mediterranea]|nr:hypothetical protein F5X96DRAFT_183450 [Biscogniauxia mediterranea]